MAYVNGYEGVPMTPKGLAQSGVTLEEQLKEVSDLLSQCHGAISRVENVGNDPPSGPAVDLGGVFGTTLMIRSQAQALRERIGSLADRIGRL